VEDTIDLALTSIALLLLSGIFVWWFWRRRSAAKAIRWPMSEATIESGVMEVVERTRYGTVELPVFSFSYRVGTEYFGGRFALRPYLTDPGPSLIERMIGRKSTVHYDPKDPATWFLPDEIVEGCTVEQNLSPHLVNLKPLD
jgi:hypothetical protein